MKPLAILSLFLLCAVAVGAQTCTPVTVSPVYDTHDDGHGPLTTLGMTGTSTQTGSFVLTGAGYGPGEPFEGGSNPTGYMATTLSGNNNAFHAQGYLNSITGASTTSTGMLAHQTINGLNYWYMYYSTNGGALSFETRIQGSDGKYTRTEYYGNPSIGDPLWTAWELKNGTLSVSHSYDFNTWSNDYSLSVTGSFDSIGWFTWTGTNGGGTGTATWTNVQGEFTSNSSYNPVYPLLTPSMNGDVGPNNVSYVPTFKAGTFYMGTNYQRGYVDTNGSFGGCTSQSWTYTLVVTDTLVDNTTSTTVLSQQTNSVQFNCVNTASCGLFSVNSSDSQGATLVSGHNYSYKESLIARAIFPGNQEVTSDPYTTTLTINVP